VNVTRDQFWGAVKQMTQDEDADEILLYMHLMLAKAAEAQVEVTKTMLREHGRNAPLFDGLKEPAWFIPINEFAEQHGLFLQHYIVSSDIEG
jgi:hypothetical protein